MESNDLLNAFLGGGLVAFIAALYKVVEGWREGTWRRQDHAYADLEKWRKDADDAREWEALQHQWWRQRAGRLEWVILVNLGPEKVPPAEPYPTRPE